MIIELLVRPGAKGHAGHGLTAGQLRDAERALTSGGFEQVAEDEKIIGRTTWSILSGRSPASPST